MDALLMRHKQMFPRTSDELLEALRAALPALDMTGLAWIQSHATLRFQVVDAEPPTGSVAEVELPIRQSGGSVEVQMIVRGLDRSGRRVTYTYTCAATLGGVAEVLAEALDQLRAFRSSDILPIRPWLPTELT
ncbi:MAG: hypothetical protein ABMB14_30755 [Myxococcota bacterium]